MDLSQRIALEAIASSLLQSGHYQQSQAISDFLLGEVMGGSLLDYIQPSTARALVRRMGFQSLAISMDEVEATDATGVFEMDFGHEVDSGMDFGVYGTHLKSAEPHPTPFPPTQHGSSWMNRLLGFGG